MLRRSANLSRFSRRIPQWQTDATRNRFSKPSAFNDAIWGPANLTITANATVAPDGTTTADDLVENSTTGVHRLSTTDAWQQKLTYDLMCYAKPRTRRYFFMQFGTPGFPSNAYAYFDLQTATVVSKGAGATSASATPMPNGFVRCVVRATATSTSPVGYFFSVSNDGTSTSYTGTNGAVAVSLWQAGMKLVTDGLPASHLSVTSSGTLASVRSTMITELFGGGGIPAEIGTLSSVASPITLTGVSTCEKITMVAYSARPRLWTPTSPNGAVVIMHQGHGSGGIGGYDQLNMNLVIQQLITAGYAVCGMVMPGASGNETNSGSPADHASLALSAFIGPVMVAVNTLANAGYTDIHMSGVSGGGWTTVLSAAIDTRIKKSFPVSGSLPLYMDFVSGGSRDAEQYIPGLTATYLDMYVMAGAGSGRLHKQINHTSDPTLGSLRDYATGPQYHCLADITAASLGGRYALAYKNYAAHEYNTTIFTDEVMSEI